MTTGTDHARQPAQADADRLLAPSTHLVLSPHYDDLPLSIGASVARIAAAGGRVLDAVIFGSRPAPDAPLHAFAEKLHRDWGLTAAEVIAARQAEERAATAILGATMTTLPFHDAIYRGDFYDGNAKIFGEVAPGESGLAAHVATAALTLIVSDSGEKPTDLAAPAQHPAPGTRHSNASVRLYAPLGIGRHVDHRITTDAGLALQSAGWDVWFYEDIPYSLVSGNPERRLGELRARGLSLEPAAVVDATAGWERKIDGIMAYPSQHATIFTDYVSVAATREAIAAALDAYHRGVGVEIVAERFWKVERR